MTNDEYILAFWLSSNNVGDNLNHYLIKRLSGKHPVMAIDRDKPHYICCGSILGEFTAASSIWGAGFFYDHQVLHYELPIYSVRGELTKSQVKKDCVVGDPALVLPFFYDPFPYTIKHKVGVIPHWSNMQRVLDMKLPYHIVDPMQSPEEFIDDLVSCESIYSESLHGLIIADAYKVPNKWVILGADSGGEYKYKDYYSTTINPNEKPLTAFDGKDFKVNTYKHDLKTLLNSCPFYHGLV